MTTSPSFRFRRWRSALTIIVIVLIAYVGSYYHLSRRGMQEAAAINTRSFLYVPLEEVVATEDLSWHYALAFFYSPANAVDRKLTGAEGPVVCMLFHLSK